MRVTLILSVALLGASVSAQNIIAGSSTSPLPLDLNGSNFTYPWSVQLYNFTSQFQTLEMAFMDVNPSNHSNGKTAVLLHGKNFCAATWEDTARALLSVGYRVVLPDQIGFCKSTKPRGYQFSLQQLALNTNKLLEAVGLGDEPITLIGHSMGGMLATRYAFMYPKGVERLVLVNPIGLEDWKAVGVPYQAIDITEISEANSNYTSVRKYEQATYYVNEWKPEYDVWVNMLVNIYHGSQRTNFVNNQAQTTDMVLTQPIVYEFGLLKVRTLLVNGMKDNTAIGKQWSPPEVQAKLGHYDLLGKETVAKIPNGELIEFEDLGHAPHIQDPERFYQALLGWLKNI